ncbi:MAG: cyclic nucleotide-binding domain-containing protein [Candidatus Latescibacteria bacterium]|nr:cyclic nucleotide-binding domain-containing protein [Candidatus Latescibacterota bacterium]
MNQQQYRMAQIVEKIRVFHGLEIQEVQRLLQVCHPKSYKQDEQVYKVGGPSTDMLILLMGKLSVIGPSGEAVAEVRPGVSIGEMGMFTGQGRSATIVAAEPSGGVVVAKKSLDVLMNSYPNMKERIFGNVIQLLSERLAEMGEKVATLTQRVEALEGGQQSESISDSESSPEPEPTSESESAPEPE